MAVRSNESDIIDWMWTNVNAWMRATHKTNYGVMGVDVTQIRYSMKKPLREIWLHHRTMSLCGNDGSNIEHDRGMEKFNLECAEHTRGRVTRDALTKFCRQMNALSWVESRFLKAVDMEGDGASTYSHVKPGDVASVVQYFKDHIGSTWAELTSAKASTLGGSTSDLPWEKVRRFREGVGDRQSTREYVTEKLSNPVTV
jgi:hypothetical protein